MEHNDIKVTWSAQELLIHAWYISDHTGKYAVCKNTNQGILTQPRLTIRVSRAVAAGQGELVLGQRFISLILEQ